MRWVLGLTQREAGELARFVCVKKKCHITALREIKKKT
jgi:hypothetical protein